MSRRQGVFGGNPKTRAVFFPKQDLTGQCSAAWYFYVASVTVITKLKQ
jgi:hypothetical protein